MRLHEWSRSVRAFRGFVESAASLRQFASQRLDNIVASHVDACAMTRARLDRAEVFDPEANAQRSVATFKAKVGARGSVAGTAPPWAPRLAWSDCCLHARSKSLCNLPTCSACTSVLCPSSARLTTTIAAMAPCRQLGTRQPGQTTPRTRVVLTGVRRRRLPTHAASPRVLQQTKQVRGLMLYIVLNLNECVHEAGAPTATRPSLACRILVQGPNQDERDAGTKVRVALVLTRQCTRANLPAVYCV